MNILFSPKARVTYIAFVSFTYPHIYPGFISPLISLMFDLIGF